MVTSECGSVTRLSRAGCTAGAPSEQLVLRLTRSINRRCNCDGRGGIVRVSVHGVGAPLGEGERGEQDHQGHARDGKAGPRVAVSYTHLTLPTIYSV